MTSLHEPRRRLHVKKSIALVCTMIALLLGCFSTVSVLAQDGDAVSPPETVDTQSSTESDAAPVSENPTSDDSDEGELTAEDVDDSEHSDDATDADKNEQEVEATKTDAGDDEGFIASLTVVKNLKTSEWTPMLGRFHPLILHFPIGVLMILFVLEVFYIFRAFQNIEPAHWLLLIVGTFAAITASAFGWFLSWEGGYDETTLNRHLWSGTIMSILCVLAIVVRAFYSYTLKHRIRHAYRGILVAIMVALTITGHYGGNLTHGEEYLFENMHPSIPIPEFIHSSNKTPVDSGSTYADVIQPILKAQCYECHSESKQKGEYQLQTRELMLTPGESGKEAVIPGNAIGSELVRLIALPGEHNDLMPPSGKGALNSDEILAIMQWIDRGADFGDGANVIELEKPDMAPAEIDTAELEEGGKVDFVKHIWPIIEASCLECHDAEEQEGELRLDTKAFILAGGEFGPVLEPGSPEDSTFYELIALDEDDPDFMPAKNEPLPDEQIDLIKRWIEEGCDFGEWTGE